MNGYSPGSPRSRSGVEPGERRRRVDVVDRDLGRGREGLAALRRSPPTALARVVARQRSRRVGPRLPGARAAASAHSMTTSRSPTSIVDARARPPTRSMVPSRGARSSFCIFMASTTSSCWPATTRVARRPPTPPTTLPGMTARTSSGPLRRPSPRPRVARSRRAARARARPPPRSGSRRRGPRGDRPAGPVRGGSRITGVRAAPLEQVAAAVEVLERSRTGSPSMRTCLCARTVDRHGRLVAGRGSDRSLARPLPAAIAGASRVGGSPPSARTRRVEPSAAGAGRAVSRAIGRCLARGPRAASRRRRSGRRGQRRRRPACRRRAGRRPTGRAVLRTGAASRGRPAASREAGREQRRGRASRRAASPSQSRVHPAGRQRRRPGTPALRRHEAVERQRRLDAADLGLVERAPQAVDRRVAVRGRGPSAWR